ncbi:MAG: tetratricopeptide repeat protein [Armatimonadota bacterium]|nr:tetratricopeptide repeat protein [bacterium]
MEQLEHSGCIAVIKAVRDADSAGDSRLSERLVEDGLAEYPESAELWSLATTIRLWRGRREEAQVALDNARRLGPDIALRWAAEADIISFEGMLDEAKEAASKALAIDRNDPWILERCISVYAIAGEFALVSELTSSWRKAFPDSAVAMTMGITCLMLVNKTEDAQALLNEAELRFPDSPLIWRKRAQLLMRSSRLNEAIELLQQAAEKLDGNWEIWSELATALSFAKRADEAERAAIKALEISSISTNALSAMARICRQRGENKEAAKWDKKASTAIPALRTVALLREANAAIRKADWKRAAAAADKAMAGSSPCTKATALEIKARALLHMNRLGEVKKTLKELESLGRTSASIYEFRGQLASKTGNSRDAAKILRDGIRQYPASGTLRAELLWVLHSLHATEEERSLIQDIFNNLPQVPWQLITLLTALDETDHKDDFHRLLASERKKYPDMEELRVIEAVDRFEKGDFAGTEQLAHGVKGEWCEIARIVEKAPGKLAKIMEIINKLFGKRTDGKPPTLN